MLLSHHTKHSCRFSYPLTRKNDSTFRLEIKRTIFHSCCTGWITRHRISKEYFRKANTKFFIFSSIDKLMYRLHSRWTIYGIESSYIRIKRRRRRRRRRRQQPLLPRKFDQIGPISHCTCPSNYSPDMV
jgi:hypothetical protein